MELRKVIARTLVNVGMLYPISRYCSKYSAYRQTSQLSRIQREAHAFSTLNSPPRFTDLTQRFAPFSPYTKLWQFSPYTWNLTHKPVNLTPKTNCFSNFYLKAGWELCIGRTCMACELTRDTYLQWSMCAYVRTFQRVAVVSRYKFLITFFGVFVCFVCFFPSFNRRRLPFRTTASSTCTTWYWPSATMRGTPRPSDRTRGACATTSATGTSPCARTGLAWGGGRLEGRWVQWNLRSSIYWDLRNCPD